MVDLEDIAESSRAIMLDTPIDAQWVERKVDWAWYKTFYSKFGASPADEKLAQIAKEEGWIEQQVTEHKNSPEVIERIWKRAEAECPGAIAKPEC